MWKLLKRRWATEGTLVQLQRLDDRLLADMGLPRDDLRDRVQGRIKEDGYSATGQSADTGPVLANVKA